MPEFISKVQHNNYEKGEFSEEKVRSLNETLDLVKNFPFDAERSLTEIKLTGPSVTIQDEDLNYLKVSLYFNGKLCIYYLDNDNHLYECYVLDIDAACELVKDFFSRTLDLSEFDKHLFNIGNQANFVTKYFEYKINRIWLLLCFLVCLFGLLIAIIGTFAIFLIKSIPSSVFILYGILDLLILQAIVLFIRVSIKTFNMSLIASAGKDIFQFGDNDNLKEYNKKEISQINIYGQTSRSSRIFNLMEIIFIDGTNIIIPGMLLDPFAFLAKFNGYKTEYRNGYISSLKFLWYFTK